MVHGIVDIFKCSYFFSVCMSACSLFLASLCPSFYGAAFERLLTSCCLCANIRQCRITLSLNRYPPLRFLFVLLNFNCSLSAAHSVYLNFLKLVIFLNRTFLLSFKRTIAIPMMENQVTRSKVFLL